jgi:replicative DNA helicase
MKLLGSEFQLQVLRLIVQDYSFLDRYRNSINHSLFKDEEYKQVAKRAINFYDKYGTIPSRSSLSEILNEEYDEEDTGNIISECYKDVIDPDYVKDKLSHFVKGVHINDTIKQAINFVKNEKYDDAQNVMQSCVDSFDGDSIGTVFWEESKNVLYEIDNKQKLISTGIPSIDYLLNGGVARKTLNVWVAPPNRGKTAALINTGKNAVINGYKVIHITLELEQNIVKRRYFQSMTRMSKVELSKKKRTAYNNILDIAQNVAHDSLIIKRFPANSCTSNQIKNHINKINNLYGFFPDVIIVDYADIMRSDKKYEQRRHELSNIYYGLREIADYYNAAVWTATRTNRTGSKEEIITMEDVGECYDVGAASDVILSINQTLDEKRKRPQTARIHFAKSRDDESQNTVEIETDWSCVWMGDLNE